METTRDNRILVTGDNLGFIRVWDISDYFASTPTTRERPRQIQEWRAHVQVRLTCERVIMGVCKSIDMSLLGEIIAMRFNIVSNTFSAFRVCFMFAAEFVVIHIKLTGDSGRDVPAHRRAAPHHPYGFL